MTFARPTNSPAIEDYLKGIYQLQTDIRPVTTSELACTLHVSAASATKMVKKLTAQKLVRHSPYHGFVLTPRGEKLALEIVRHHRLVESFLHETLDMPWDEVHAEAERIEHVISEALEDRIALKLGDPAADPHGDPIPTKSGRLERPKLVRLIDLTPGREATIRRVSAQEPPHLRYLATLGLVPNAQIQIVDQAPFGGPLKVRVGREERILSQEFAQQIWVSLDRIQPRLRPRNNASTKVEKTGIDKSQS